MAKDVPETATHDQIVVHVTDGAQGTFSCDCNMGKAHVVVIGEDD